MIDRPRLLADLKPLLTDLEDDLRARLEDQADLGESWRSEYRQAREARRTGSSFEVWRDEQLTQVAVAWVLGCVFQRFLEDNGLVDAPGISGPGERLEEAVERNLLYFREFPEQTNREYFLHLFEQAAALPGAGEVFDRAHNPLWRLGPSGKGVIRGLSEPHPSGRAHAGGLRLGILIPRRRAPAREIGRWGVLRAAQRRRSGDDLRLGHFGDPWRVGCRLLGAPGRERRCDRHLGSSFDMCAAAQETISGSGSSKSPRVSGWRS